MADVVTDVITEEQLSDSDKLIIEPIPEKPACKLPCQHLFHEICIRSYVENAGREPTPLGVTYLDDEVMALRPPRCPNCRARFAAADYWPELAGFDEYPDNGFKYTESVNLGDWEPGATVDAEWAGYIHRIAGTLQECLPDINVRITRNNLPLICAWIIVANRAMSKIVKAKDDKTLPEGARALASQLHDIVLAGLEGPATRAIRACSGLNYNLDEEQLEGAYDHLMNLINK